MMMMMMADDHDTLGYLQGGEEYLDEDLVCYISLVRGVSHVCMQS